MTTEEVAQTSQPLLPALTNLRCSHRASFHAKSSTSHPNFVRTARWSPDGSAVLTENEDRTIRLYDMPSTDDKTTASQWNPRIEVPSADAVTSTCWYPGARADDPATMCFVSAVKDHPVHLRDAVDGRLRASYPIVDHREKTVAPHSMIFSPDGTTLYCGIDSAVEVFDLSRPGAGNRIKTVPTRKSKEGQKGIISSLAIDNSGTGLLAAGSLSGSIGLYDHTTSLSPVLVFPNSSSGSGVTQVSFHPTSPILLSTSRRSSSITAYDIRYTATVLTSFERPGDTNQRIEFSLDPWGRWIVSGGTDGKVRIWDAHTMDPNPTSCLDLHSDTIPSAAIHPWKPALLTCAGSRRFSSPYSETDDSSGEEDVIKEQACLALWEFETTVGT